MHEGFFPALLGCLLSTELLNPGEALWVTLTWQNQGDRPAPRDYRFFLDGAFGHQRRLENKRFDFRLLGESLPGTTRWTPGRIASVTLRWEAGSEWSGTFRLSAGLLDGEGVPLVFAGQGGAPTRLQAVGEVDTSWNLGRPWVREHARPAERTFQPPQPVPAAGERPAFFQIADEITLGLEEGRPVLRGIGGGSAFRDFACAEPQAVLRERASGRVYREGESDCVVRWSLTERGASSAGYHAEAAAGGTRAASFDLMWRVEGRAARLSLQNRWEADGWELLELRYDTLAELAAGTLLDFWGAGREIPIAETVPAFFEKKYDVRNAAALYDDEVLLLVESEHIDSRLTTGVLCTDAGRRGFIGGSAVCRVRAEPGMPSIPVQNPPSFTLELPDLAGRRPSWQEAAKLWRRGLRRNAAFELYRNTYFYKQLATWGPLPDAAWRRGDPHPLTQNLFKTVTFDQISENAKGFSRLTDGAKQILYVAGWQKGGFDDAYPEPYDAEERCGGLAGLRRCLEETRKYHAVMGLHDNFDDVSSGRAASFPYTALDEAGRRWRGWIWAAGMTYIMGVKKYVDSGAARERIERMCELLPLRESYHLDVLTAEVCRYDFDPAHPASAQDSLDAKLQIVEEFNRHGLDVTSEVLTHPFVGKVGFALHNRFDPDGEFLPGDRFVPLVEMIYHGTIGYCAPSRTRRELLWGILLGGQTFYEEDITGELCVSRYYLQNIPAMLLYGKTLECFEREGSRAVAAYEGGDRVEVDFEAETYTAIIGGAVVGKDFTTLAPGNRPGTWLAYSLDGGGLRRPAPRELQAADKITAVALTKNGDGAAVPARIEGGELVLELPAATPVRISMKSRKGAGQ